VIDGQVTPPFTKETNKIRSVVIGTLLDLAKGIVISQLKVILFPKEFGIRNG